MILGIGIDHVRLSRFAAAVQRTPELLPRLFGPEERTLPLASLAARFAAKEAAVKALGGAIPDFRFVDIQTPRPAPGRVPVLSFSGGVRRRADALGVRTVHLSLTHEDPLATAIVILEGAL
ncbi:MAG: holo-ACP synthase [Microbacteriaceae bacterium]|nr:holo-ACP synthase [Microbacteriaceae bacterium]MCI1206899.1 holo-ACP synthase [Microbacteriaceae bacterium]